MLKNLLKASLLALGLITLSLNVQAQEFKGVYSHYSDAESLNSVLIDFARSQGLSAQISSAVTGTVNGRFEEVDPKVFLSAMQAAFGVKYYRLGTTIYFYHENEETSAIYRPSSLEISKIRSLLNASHLVSEDLPLKLNPQGLLVFTGPQTYVTALLQVSEEFDKREEQQVIMQVFKLKHAKAQDLQIDSMDKVVNIPGVASILKAMVSGGATGGGALAITTKSPSVQSLRGQGLSGIGAPPVAPASTQVNISAQANAASKEQEAGAPVEFSPNIIADTRLNAVVIQDYQYRMPYYEEVIRELDVPLRLVELHAAIVDVDVNATKDLGIDWQAARNSGNWALGGGVGRPSWDGSFPMANSGNGGIFSTVFSTNHSRFMAQINMLEEDNKARTLGRPSVLTMDNVEATLENTTTNYIPVRGYESSDLFKVESGTVLRVTPHIIEDLEGGAPYIQMVISLQSNQESDAGNQSLVGDNGEVYLAPISQTKINTQALVREGQSLLLGGYYVQNATETDSGVPGAKDLKGVGGLFGTEGESSYTRERLLLITPRVLELNELNVPQDLDDPRFYMSPTQDRYQKREIKAKESGGCSANTEVEEKPQTQTVPQIINVSSQNGHLVQEIQAK